MLPLTPACHASTPRTLSSLALLLGASGVLALRIATGWGDILSCLASKDRDGSVIPKVSVVDPPLPLRNPWHVRPYFRPPRLRTAQFEPHLDIEVEYCT